ncbi:MAG: glycoside hydrolase family 2 TIM barrel-domain containing protein, partial [Bacteroidota bacterium]
MRIALLLLLATVVPWALPLVAQPAAPLANLYDRTRLSLNGEWAYIVEPFGRAIDNRNIRRDFPADQQAQPGGPLIEYDWEASPTLQVPGDWNHQDPTLWHYEGAVWHRKRFGAEVPDGMRAFLYFEAANYIAHVFLNNEKLGVHEGGFTPFAFEVTDHLRAGADANSLVVAVDNTRRAHQIPSKRFDWWNYGGLTRPVWIVLVPDTHIHDYTVRFDDTDGDVITAEVVLDGPDRGEQPVTLRIPELNVEATATTGLTGVATLRVRPEGLTRWSPEDPQRYTVSIEAGADRVEEPMGFRTVAVRGTDILVNGEPVFLRGISIHEEAFDEQGRRATSPEDLRALMEAAKGLNTNFVRLAHYPHSEQMTRLADSLGLLVWSEVPIYWEDITYNNPQTLGLARAMVEAMVERDKNRASIIIWSVANETPIEEHRLTFLRTLIQDVRTLDPTRLVSAALKS